MTAGQLAHVKRETLTKSLAWCGIALSIAAGVFYRNPALALLGTLAVRLILDVNPIASSSKYSKLSLQTAIVLLGLTLGLDQLVDHSAEYGVIVAIYVVGTLVLGAGLVWLMQRLRRRSAADQDGDIKEPALLTAGTAICGGTAIATLAPLMDAQSKQFAVAAALVFLLNIVAVFTFPWIGQWLNLSQETFGAWVALAVHDTSSVVATAAIYGDQATAVATTVKLGRTLWLIPLAFAVSLIYRQGDAKLRVPLFVVLFVAAAGLASLLDLPAAVTQGVATVSKALLVFALAMIGLDISRATLRTIRPSTFAFGIGLWVLVAPAALLLVLYL